MRTEDYAGVGSLGEALKVCRQSLKADGRGDYVPLLTEERVRAAIGVALVGYRHRLEKRSMPYGEEFPSARDKEVLKEIKNFEEVVRPVFLDIAGKGSWPAGASFEYYLFRVDDNLVRYEGLSLRLHIQTPGALFMGFAVAILDLYYGHGIRGWDDEE